MVRTFSVCYARSLYPGPPTAANSWASLSSAFACGSCEARLTPALPMWRKMWTHNGKSKLGDSGPGPVPDEVVVDRGAGVAVQVGAMAAVDGVWMELHQEPGGHMG